MDFVKSTVKDVFLSVTNYITSLKKSQKKNVVRSHVVIQPVLSKS